MTLTTILSTRNLNLIEKCYDTIDRIMVDLENDTYDDIDGPYTLQDLEKVCSAFPDKKVTVRIKRDSEIWNRSNIEEVCSPNIFQNNQLVKNTKRW